MFSLLYDIFMEIIIFVNSVTCFSLSERRSRLSLSNSPFSLSEALLSLSEVANQRAASTAYSCKYSTYKLYCIHESHVLSINYERPKIYT